MSKAKQGWTVFPANAHRTTEVPLIGLTLRSILLPHRSLHSAHVLPLITRCCTPPPSLHPLPPKRLLTFCQRCSLVCLHSPFTQEDMLKFSTVERLLCHAGEMDHRCVLLLDTSTSAGPLSPPTFTLLCSLPRESYECML